MTDALAGINRILRDHRSGETHPIDPQLLDVLHALSRKMETRAPFHVISGYRSPTTSATLRGQGRGVASGSLHIVGKAIDIRVPGVELTALRGSARGAWATTRARTSSTWTSAASGPDNPNPLPRPSRKGRGRPSPRSLPCQMSNRELFDS